MLRFRSGLVAYSGDVSKMFLMINLHPDDRPFHCFLWRTDPKEEPCVFRFNVHVFGNTGSPFVAVFVVKEHSKKYEGKFPQAVDALHRSPLIDDVLDSPASVPPARANVTHIVAVMAAAGRTMAKIHPCQPPYLQDLPPSPPPPYHTSPPPPRHLPSPVNFKRARPSSTPPFKT